MRNVVTWKVVSQGLPVFCRVRPTPLLEAAGAQSCMTSLGVCLCKGIYLQKCAPSQTPWAHISTNGETQVFPVCRGTPRLGHRCTIFKPRAPPERASEVRGTWADAPGASGAWSFIFQEQEFLRHIGLSPWSSKSTCLGQLVSVDKSKLPVLSYHEANWWPPQNRSTNLYCLHCGHKFGSFLWPKGMGACWFGICAAIKMFMVGQRQHLFPARV